MKWMTQLKKTFPSARVYLVGGAVRDRLLRRKTKDNDFVVAGVDAAELERFLARQGSVNLVGRTFGVFKFRARGTKEEIDIALPRTEHPKGTGGYKDVETQSDPDLPIEKDLARRDFTINAMGVDVAKDKLVDPFGGRRDLRKKIMRAVGKPRERFREDYTRVLRGLRFAVQLGFAVEKKTWDAMRAFAPRLEAKRKDGSRVVPTEVAVREFRKAFAADPLTTLILWRDVGTLKPRLPELGTRLLAGRLMARGAPSSDGLVILEHLLKDASAAEALAVAAFLGASPSRVDAWARALGKLRMRPLLDGKDVMRALGLKKPSPKVGEALRALRKAQFDGRLRNRRHAADFLRHRA